MDGVRRMRRKEKEEDAQGDSFDGLTKLSEVGEEEDGRVLVPKRRS